MSTHTKYVPKHRAEPTPSPLARAPRAALRSTALLSTVAVAATGVAVSGGVLGQSGGGQATAATDLRAIGSLPTAEPESVEVTGEVEDRTRLSRSDSREESDPAKEAALAPTGGRAMTAVEDLSDADPRDIAKAMLPQFGFGADQFGCLDALWVSESDWRVDADNPTSSAYGIPQALTQLHDLPADYMTSAEAQIRWGLGYIRDAYGSPCNAWSFKQGHNWY